MPTRFIAALTVVVPGLVLLAACSSPKAVSRSAQSPAKPDVHNLLLTPLAAEFTPGREVLVDLVQIPPHATLERHRHPGEEFHYYLEGEAEIRIEGEPSIIGKPGTVGHVPYMKWHQAIAHEQGAKILVFRVHTQGQPWRYVDKDASPHEAAPAKPAR
jgi:quercetin dioxygenase-like cupin family protein